MSDKKSRIKKASPTPVMVDREVLARLAYEFFLRRGGEHGHDVEDWLTAERLLLEESRERQRARGRRSPTSRLRRRLEDKFGAL